MAYKTTITAIGAEVEDFIQENFLIVFNENAPDGLAEISALHTIVPFEKELRKGDTVVFGDRTYQVTAVGTEANETLKKLGHCTFVFDGQAEPDLPGHVCLEKKPAPTLQVGDVFEVHFQ